MTLTDTQADILAQLTVAVEYTDHISAEGSDLSLPTRVFDMTLSCIWCWGSSSGALGNVKYSFIAITPRYTLNWSGSTC